MDILCRAGTAIVACLVARVVATTPAPAQDFFAGKTITVAIGSRVGGSYDAYGRLVARHMPRHIPGNPTMVPKNMPGAAGTRVANYAYNVAPKDGTYLVATLNSIPLTQIMRPKKAKYEVAKFNWIGAINSPAHVLATWHTSGIKTIEDARKREVVIGGTTAGTSMEMYPTISNRLLGTKFKVVLGYRGGKGVNLAMERGEVEGRGSNSWLSYKMRNPDWVRDGKIHVLFQMSLKRAPTLPNTPTLIELAKTDEDRQIIAVLTKSETIGRSLLAPPGVPAARVALLRAAFDGLVKDPKMLKDAKRSKLPIRPTSGSDLQTMVESVFKTPETIMKKFLAAVKPKK
jgi:tripartite-type tricarboxylate transporter receptor subunit TctC